MINEHSTLNFAKHKKLLLRSSRFDSLLFLTFEFIFHFQSLLFSYFTIIDSCSFLRFSIYFKYFKYFTRLRDYESISSSFLLIILLQNNSTTISKYFGVKEETCVSNIFRELIYDQLGSLLRRGQLKLITHD